MAGRSYSKNPQGSANNGRVEPSRRGGYASFGASRGGFLTDSSGLGGFGAIGSGCGGFAAIGSSRGAFAAIGQCNPPTFGSILQANGIPGYIPGSFESMMVNQERSQHPTEQQIDGYYPVRSDEPLSSGNNPVHEQEDNQVELETDNVSGASLAGSCNMVFQSSTKTKAHLRPGTLVLEPSHQLSAVITKIFPTTFRKEFMTWGDMTTEHKGLLFDEFKKYVFWDGDEDEELQNDFRRAWEIKAREKYPSFMSNLKKCIGS